MTYKRVGHWLLPFVGMLPLIYVVAAYSEDDGANPSATVQTGMVSGQVESAVNGVPSPAQP